MNPLRRAKASSSRSLIKPGLLVCGLLLLPQLLPARSFVISLAERKAAKLYEVEIHSGLGADHSKPQLIRSKYPSIQLELKPGAYTLKTRAYDHRGVPGRWGSPSPLWIPPFAPKRLSPSEDQKLMSRAPENSQVKFSWQPVEGASKYRVKIFSAAQPDSPVKSTDVEGTQAELDLKVAQSYRWSVVALGPEEQEGDAPENNQDFTLIGPPLDRPEVSEPNNWFVRELVWEKPPYAETYSYRLLHKSEEDSEWKQIAAKTDHPETRIEIPASYPGGSYRFELKAQAQHRQSSEPQTIEFGLISGDRSERSEQQAQLLASFEKPSNFYFIASYLITMMDYASINAEDGLRATYDAIGGTGRIGLGYQRPKSRVGYLGIIDHSGIVIQGENFTFTSAELQVVHQTYLGPTRVRLGTGFYAKQLPETRGTSEATMTTESVAAAGWHGGAELWYPLTLRLGLQANARIYYPLLSLQTPNDLDQVPVPSYQVGVMGSYRLGISSVGFLGYAYRLDQMAYKPSSVYDPDLYPLNEVSIGGHYLNLLLEWAF